MTELAIIGAGVAGAALALRLAAAGRQVVLLEREPAPAHKVCGEFLSHEACTYLRSLGIDPVALGAVPIRRVQLHTADSSVCAALPFAGLSLSRRTLDEALLLRAERAGARVKRGARVTGVDSQAKHVRVQLAHGESIEAHSVFVASGKHDLHGLRRPRGLHNELVGLKLHYRLAPEQTAELVGQVELALFAGGYLGLEPVEDGVSNACLVIGRRELQAAGPGWPALLKFLCERSPHTARRLRAAEPCWAKPLAVSFIPYGFVRRRSTRLWYLGDQAAVIPSFCGDGISIALHSAALAAASYLSGERADTYQKQLARDVSVQVRLASLLSHALVRGAPQRLLLMAARQWPRLVPALARRTRIPNAALARALDSGVAA